MTTAVMMYVRMNEDRDGLHMSGPFFGGRICTEEQLQHMIKEINEDPNRPKGIIVPKTFPDISIVDVFRTATRSFNDMLEDMVESFSVVNKRKMVKKPLEKTASENEREAVERKLRRYELLCQDGLEQLATKISDKRREELKKTIQELQDNIESTKIWLKYYQPGN